MEKWIQSSRDFILLGLLPQNHTGLLLLLLIISIFSVVLLDNSAMIHLIRVDPKLHTSMYFLLSQLSLMDLMHISTSVPELAFNFLSGQKSITLLGFRVQSFFFLNMSGSEGLFLASMFYDHFVAICHPLHYPIPMSKMMCLETIIRSWTLGSINSLSHTVYLLHVPYFHSRSINHLFWDVPAMLPQACMDTWVYEYMVFVSTSLFFLLPFLGITASCGWVLFAVFHMRSKEGKKKAFTTCSTHVTVVTFYYAPFVYTYLHPRSLHSPTEDKILAVFYTILTPVLNHIIYTLRNMEDLGAMTRVSGTFSFTKTLSFPLYSYFSPWRMTDSSNNSCKHMQQKQVQQRLEPLERKQKHEKQKQQKQGQQQQMWKWKQSQKQQLKCFCDQSSPV
ncbi:olfactory receptor 2L13-like [Peromyscus eremicus]|uniref:olfactory receptor 2L13-like n=1 Tax=Peromyscus eremicus TaxID=42410 RepID=UPI0027DB3D39|nr:olfactory receptor 2L13-like [Peromyscus eremicus]